MINLICLSLFFLWFKKIFIIIGTWDFKKSVFFTYIISISQDCYVVFITILLENGIVFLVIPFHIYPVFILTSFPWLALQLHTPIHHSFAKFTVTTPFYLIANTPP